MCKSQDSFKFSIISSGPSRDLSFLDLCDLQRWDCLLFLLLGGVLAFFARVAV